MTAPAEEYAQSYPPAVLMGAPRSASRTRARLPAGGGAAAAAPAGTDTGSQLASLQLTAGPAGYGGAVKPADRPRNLEELAQRVTLQDSQPWPAGAGVPIGTRGKRAHWTGAEWKGGESPGYAAPVTDTTTAGGGELSAVVDPPVQLTETPATPAETPAVQFPGDGGDSAEELHR